MERFLVSQTGESATCRIVMESRNIVEDKSFPNKHFDYLRFVEGNLTEVRSNKLHLLSRDLTR